MFPTSRGKRGLVKRFEMGTVIGILMFYHKPGQTLYERQDGNLTVFERQMSSSLPLGSTFEIHLDRFRLSQ